MRRFRSYCLLMLVFCAAGSLQASRIRRGPTSSKHKATKAQKTSAAAHPRAMDDERATQIQSALVKAGYLNDVSGHWDSASQAAMQKLQSDNGWQTKLIPDSRALIKLGLGPNALNAAPAGVTASGTVLSEERDGN